MRRKIIAGNWKMNLAREEALNLTNNIGIKDNCEVYIFPPSIYLYELAVKLAQKNIKIGAQNAFYEEKGAYTGEISMSQLQSIQINTVLIGHSERRSIFNENDELIAKKVKVALDKGLEVFFCCGEPLEIRESNRYLEYIENQLKVALKDLKDTDLKNLVIAYEPVWAIGTGKTASPEQAEEVHAFIRQYISKIFNQEIANNLSILYGGSCKPNNAAGLFSKPNIDGGLIGGAALKANDFNAIIEAI